jgi:hypothetical protein
VFRLNPNTRLSAFAGDRPDNLVADTRWRYGYVVGVTLTMENKRASGEMEIKTTVKQLNGNRNKNDNGNEMAMQMKTRDNRRCRRCIEHDDPERARGHIAADCPHYERQVRCNECNQQGHLRAECPRVTCSKCQQLGHSAANCPIPDTCRRCHLPGHTSRNCTTVISRQTSPLLSPLLTLLSKLPPALSLIQPLPSPLPKILLSLSNR